MLEEGPEISVVVPARDAEATLPATLGGIAAQQIDHELIVVDDASGDSTAAIAERNGAVVIRNRRPLGPGACRNAGAAAATGIRLAFCDADCVPTSGWLSAGARALDRAGLVQGRVEPNPEAELGPFDKTLWVTRPWGLFESANLFVRREVFERLGGFDDGLLELAGDHFGEDVIFGWRARRAGVVTAFSDRALVHHAVFRRSPAEYVRERRRTALFAALVRQVPELRDTFLYRRWFLSPRSAAFAGLALAALASALRRPLPAALAAAPYARLLALDLRSGPEVAAVRIAADAVGFGSLIRGSVRERTLLL